jgi:REP element-mobilizing transposase RayT
MPQSLVEIYVHIVFSTKGREPFLQDGAFRDRTHGYLKGICDGQDSPSLQIGGVEDHVHDLCRLGKTLDVSTLIRELKRESSKWIKIENQSL